MKTNESTKDLVEILDVNINALQEIIDPEGNESDFSLMQNNYNQAIELQSHIKQAVALLDVDVDDDFKFVQTNLRVLIEQANGSLARLVAIAENSEHPRAFEVLSTYISTVAAINKDLLELHKTKRDITREDGGAKQQTDIQQQNNVVFAGTSADFLREIINKTKG